MSGEKAPRKQSFLQGVAVLTAATIIVKLLGFIYKVPLQNILQERGFGYFNTAYDAVSYTHLDVYKRQYLFHLPQDARAEQDHRRAV